MRHQETNDRWIRRRLHLASAVLLYLACLGLAYVFIIAPVYGYTGMVAHSAAWWRLFIVTGFALFPLTFLPARWRSPLDASPWVFYLIAYIPACLVPVFAFTTETGLWWRTPIGMLSGLASLCLFLRLRLPFSVNNLSMSRRGTVQICLVLAAGLLALMLFAAAGFTVNLDFSSHYDRRFAAREVTQIAPWLGYGSSWLTFFFIPVLAALAVTRREAWLGALSFIFGLVVFSFDGTKNWILLAFISAGATWLFCKPRPQSPIPVILGLAIMAILSLLEPLILSSIPYTDLLTRRILAVPGFLAGCYFDFFGQSPHLLYSDVTLINKLTANPYGTSAGFIIGETHLGTPGMNANAGIWPNGFAQAGTTGIIVYSLLAAIVLRFFHHQWARYHNPLVPSAIIISSFIWVESSIPTSLSTAGIGFWLLIFIINPTQISRNKNTRSAS